MTKSIDVYAQTNPAFLGIVLHQFVIGYKKASAEYPDYPLMFLPCPIALSKSWLARWTERMQARGLQNGTCEIQMFRLVLLRKFAAPWDLHDERSNTTY